MRKTRERKRKNDRVAIDDDTVHPSIIPTCVFMAAGLAYTISNPISMRPIGKTLPFFVDDLFSFVKL